MTTKEKFTAKDVQTLRQRTGADYRTLVAYGNRGRSLLDTSFGPGRGLGGLVLASNQPASTDDYPNDGRFVDQFPEVIDEEHLRSVVAVPVRLDGAIEALLYAGRREQRAFTEGEAALLARLSDHAAIALHNAHFPPFQSGQVHLRDVAYYLLVTWVALFATTRVLEARRWR